MILITSTVVCEMNLVDKEQEYGYIQSPYWFVVLINLHVNRSRFYDEFSYGVQFNLILKIKD